MNNFDDINRRKSLLAKRDKAWLDIRGKKELIIDILVDPSSFDKSLLNDEYLKKAFTAIAECLLLVIEEFVIRQQQFEEMVLDDNFKHIDCSNFTSDTIVIDDFIRKQFVTFMNKEETLENRLKIKQYIDNQVWRQFYRFHNDIINLFHQEETQLFTSEEITLVLQCMAMVLFELFMNDAEIALIEGSFDEFINAKSTKWYKKLK